MGAGDRAGALGLLAAAFPGRLQTRGGLRSVQHSVVPQDALGPSDRGGQALCISLFVLYFIRAMTGSLGSQDLRALRYVLLRVHLMGVLGSVACWPVSWHSMAAGAG